MKVKRFLKNNLFLVLVLGTYGVLAVIQNNFAAAAVGNSLYFFKEMIMIMPAVFVLTALLDAWVPKATILQYLGAKSGGKGIFLSFAMGSISAGPIYSAFPICVMLLKKGASVRNVVIILSSWAVIKIPMLINEVKFLGFAFMATRWVLTVAAILCFSAITNRLVKKEQMPGYRGSTCGLVLRTEFCMGCTLCHKAYPALFAMEGNKATVLDHGEIDWEKLDSAIAACPAKAIEYNG